MNFTKQYCSKAEFFSVRSLRALLLLTLIMSLLFSQAACSGVSKEKVPFTQSLERGQSAYIDVVTIIPVYSVNSGQGLSSYITDIVCKCVTTIGSTVWLVISPQNYRDCIDAKAVFGDTLMGSTFHEVTLNTRVHGTVKEADDVSDGLSAKTAKMVLDFIYREKTPFKTEHEKPFSISMGDSLPAYADIRTIKPAYVITSGIAKVVTEVVCKCETVSGATVWVVMTKGEYKSYIDPTAQLDSVGLPAAEMTINSRIHGKTLNSEKIDVTLAGKTDKLVLVFASMEEIP